MIFGRSSECYVTCRDRTDGGGAQISAQISAMIYARMRGARYAHTPLEKIEHMPGGMSSGAWAKAWEECFSLGNGEVQAKELTHLPEHRLDKPHRRRPKGKQLNVVAHCHKLTDRHPEAWVDIAPNLRRKYFLQPKPELPDFNRGTKHVAIHLRRGDVGTSGPFTDRYTPAERMLPALKQVMSTLGENTKLHFYSQGTPEDFAEFREFEPIWHLDEDVFTSFHGMVMADVLFSAISTFSYLAGVIGQNTVIYQPFRHPALPGWLTLDSSADEFTQALSSRDS